MVVGQKVQDRPDFCGDVDVAKFWMSWWMRRFHEHLNTADLPNTRRLNVYEENNNKGTCILHAFNENYSVKNGLCVCTSSQIRLPLANYANNYPYGTKCSKCMSRCSSIVVPTKSYLHDRQNGF